MDMGWVQVFILTMSECVAPAGKSVCQEQQFELEFLKREDCEYALQQMIAMKDEVDYIIVNRAKSRCSPSAANTAMFASAEAVSEATEDNAGWRAPENAAVRPTVVNASHTDRLSDLKSCDETGGAAPCKIGEIIVEQEGDDGVEVWRRDD